MLTELTNTLLGNWLIALPLLFATVGLISLATYRLSKSLAVASIVASGCLLLVGIVQYYQAPGISIVCLILGFCIILVQVVGDVRGGLNGAYNKSIKENKHDVEKKR